MRVIRGFGWAGGESDGVGGVREVGLENIEDETRRNSHPRQSAMRNTAHPLTGDQDVAAQRSKRQSSCN